MGQTSGPFALVSRYAAGLTWLYGQSQAGGGEMLFIDRAEAGRRLAQRLRYLRGTDVAVLGLPRGGVPVAFEVAEELGAPLDVIVVRKLGVPGQPEYGFGAIGEDGTRTIDVRVVRLTALTAPEIAAVEARERTQLDRRVRRLRGDRAPVPLTGRTVIVVDDGIATGSTARAACMVARSRGASRVILAVPVGSAEAAASLRHAADEVICLHTPTPFFAISQWYGDFSQVSDQEVTALLDKAAGRQAGRQAGRSAPGQGRLGRGLRLPLIRGDDHDGAMRQAQAIARHRPEGGGRPGTAGDPGRTQDEHLGVGGPVEQRMDGQLAG